MGRNTKSRAWKRSTKERKRAEAIKEQRIVTNRLHHLCYLSVRVERIIIKRGIPIIASKEYIAASQYIFAVSSGVSLSVAPAPRPVRPVVHTPTASQPKAQPQITQTAFTINIGDEVKKVWIPNSVKDVFTNEVQIPEDNDIATTENVAHVAMLLFAGYIDAATSMSESCGGGGSAPSSGWGKKDDEDDWKFAHRCAQMAHSMCKPKPRSRSFHR